MVSAGAELKIALPQPGLDPLEFAGLGCRRCSVQLWTGPTAPATPELAMAFC